MRKNIFNKTLIILVFSLIIVLLNCNIVFGTINTDITISNKLIHESESIGNRLIGALQVIGIFVLVAATIVVGIKFMLCSIEEKAEYKKTAIIYLTGAALICASTQIVNIIYKFLN